MIPDVVVGEGARNGRREVPPPGSRLDGDRIELDAVTGRPFAAPGHVESDGRLPIDGRQLEAPLIEMRPAKGVSAPQVVRRGRPVVQNRIALELVAMAAAIDDRLRDRTTEELGNTGWCAGPQIQHAASRRVPGTRPGQIDVDVILERHVRTEHAEDVDL